VIKILSAGEVDTLTQQDRVAAKTILQSSNVTANGYLQVVDGKMTWVNTYCYLDDTVHDYLSCLE
jgi:hypothetical protein